MNKKFLTLILGTAISYCCFSQDLSKYNFLFDKYKDIGLKVSEEIYRESDGVGFCYYIVTEKEGTFLYQYNISNKTLIKTGLKACSSMHKDVNYHGFMPNSNYFVNFENLLYKRFSNIYNTITISIYQLPGSELIKTLEINKNFEFYWTNLFFGSDDKIYIIRDSKNAVRITPKSWKIDDVKISKMPEKPAQEVKSNRKLLMIDENNWAMQHNGKIEQVSEVLKNTDVNLAAGNIDLIAKKQIAKQDSIKLSKVKHHCDNVAQIVTYAKPGIGIDEKPDRGIERYYKFSDGYYGVLLTNYQVKIDYRNRFFFFKHDLEPIFHEILLYGGNSVSYRIYRYENKFYIDHVGNRSTCFVFDMNMPTGKKELKEISVNDIPKEATLLEANSYVHSKITNSKIDLRNNSVLVYLPKINLSPDLINSEINKKAAISRAGQNCTEGLKEYIDKVDYINFQFKGQDLFCVLLEKENYDLALGILLRSDFILAQSPGNSILANTPTKREKLVEELRRHPSVKEVQLWKSRWFKLNQSNQTLYYSFENNGMSKFSGEIDPRAKLFKGKLIDPYGFTYTGLFNEFGLLTGNGELITNNRIRFTGNFTNGVLNGNGKAILADGGTYEGGFLNTLYHGQGKLNRPSTGERYEGEFKKGQMHGSGIYWNDGQPERCEFYEGQRIDQAYLIAQENRRAELQRKYELLQEQERQRQIAEEMERQEASRRGAPSLFKAFMFAAPVGVAAFAGASSSDLLRISSSAMQDVYINNDYNMNSTKQSVNSNEVSAPANQTQSRPTTQKKTGTSASGNQNTNSGSQGNNDDDKCINHYELISMGKTPCPSRAACKCKVSIK